MSPIQKSPTVFVADLVERVGSTFAIAFLTTMLTVSGSARVGWADAAAIAGLAALGSLITTVLVWMAVIKAIANPYVDLAYRAAITFLQTLLAAVTAAKGFDLLTFHWDKALEAALLAAGASLLKSLIGLQNHSTLGASPVVLRSTGPTRPKNRRLPLVA